MAFFDFLNPTSAPLIERSTERMVSMLETSKTMFEAATGYLLDNQDISIDLKALDDTVNAGEREIRRSVLEHMAVNPSDDLSHGLLLLSVVQDAERCGDLAKSIAKAADLAAAPGMGRQVERLSNLRDRVVSQYPRTITALRDGDAEAARSVMTAHDEMKGEIGAFLQDLAAADDLPLDTGVALTLSSQYVGRVSSHLSNIASAVAMPFDLVRNSPSAAVA
ncbi:MAG: PhoU domain-containing protein [Bacteroidota bacterium]